MISVSLLIAFEFSRSYITPIYWKPRKILINEKFDFGCPTTLDNLFFSIKLNTLAMLHIRKRMNVGK